MSRKLTVATLNLWGLNAPADYTARRGEVRGALPGSPATTMRPPGGAWSARRRRLVADALRRSGAAIVGLQEDHQDLTRSIPGSAHRSQSDQLAADLGLDVFHITTVREDGVPKGNAILTRYPILWTERLPLPAGEGEEERFGAGARDALYAAVDTPIGLVHVFVVHFTTRGQRQQLEEATHLLEHVERLASDGTAIVVGDLNAKPTSPTLSLLTRPTRPTPPNGFRLRDAWAEVNPDDPGFTMPIHSPRTPQDTHMRIDYVLVGPGPEIGDASLLANAPDPDGFYASDHFGVATTLLRPSA